MDELKDDEISQKILFDEFSRINQEIHLLGIEDLDLKCFSEVLLDYVVLCLTVFSYIHIDDFFRISSLLEFHDFDKSVFRVNGVLEYKLPLVAVRSKEAAHFWLQSLRVNPHFRPVYLKQYDRVFLKGVAKYWTRTNLLVGCSDEGATTDDQPCLEGDLAKYFKLRSVRMFSVRISGFDVDLLDLLSLGLDNKMLAEGLGREVQTIKNRLVFIGGKISSIGPKVSRHELSILWMYANFKNKICPEEIRIAALLILTNRGVRYMYCERPIYPTKYNPVTLKFAV